MKGRLFWKIWLGFWLAYLFMYACTAILYFERSAGPVDPAWDAPRTVGRTVVEMAGSVLQRDGADSLARQSAAWPIDVRRRLRVVPLATDRCAPASDPRQIARRIEPDWCLRYTPGPLPEVTDDWSAWLIPLDAFLMLNLAGMVFSAGLAWYVARPIHSLRRGFERLADGELDLRLAHSMGRRRDEVADLAKDFDRMADRLEQLVQARDRLLHDVSHELRSPLARLRLASGIARDNPAKLAGALDRIDRETISLDALVGELLTLSRIESGAGNGDDYFDALEVLRVITVDAAFEAQLQGVTLVTNGLSVDRDGADWLVAGSGLLAHRGIENIFRNALRFSGRGQSIRTTLRRSDGAAVVEIDDEGPGIDEAVAKSLFEPFVQGAGQSRTGFGLGLEIARRAIEACGGTVTLRNRSDAGLRVTVSLPLARPR
ncbi:HAMP domain-containing sensor histidine kinase [Sphingomonas sp. Leaf343]|uniref:HAMP domain-containing sensor histidine kinase n=1 Tax=Sphingomonas sp. Leaf343 TaxID=1736345 RepID=UPI000700A384|nr:HAMP domain-containing sensor histidine kinase [Sphingomonas sp. Leaf343]KQR81364.1 hypothetical protein ASG07_13095 [Sphingomonas sp. Leaf343]